MNHYRDFCYWLRGYIEGSTTPDPERVLACLEAAFKQEDAAAEKALQSMRQSILAGGSYVAKQ